MLQPPTCSFYTSSGDRDVPSGVLPRFPIRIGNLDLTLNIHVVRASNYDILLGSDFFHQSGATLNYVDRTLTYRVDCDHFASVPITFDTSTSVMYAEGTPLLPGVPSGKAISPIAPDTDEDNGMPALLSDPEDADYGPDEDEAPPPLVGNDSDDEYESDDDTGRPSLIHPDSDFNDDADKDEDPPPLVQDDSDYEYDSDYKDELNSLMMPPPTLLSLPSTTDGQNISGQTRHPRPQLQRGCRHVENGRPPSPPWSTWTT
jgi:hypothetical protein